MPTVAQPAEAPPAQRFVQLPTDTERSSTVGFEAASSTWVRFENPGGALNRSRWAQPLGALVALLHRYTQQNTIALDIVVHEGAAQEGALDIETASDGPVSSLIEAAEIALAAISHGAMSPGGPSNIAATFGLSPRELGPASEVAAASLATGARYDVCFFFARTPDASYVALGYNAKLYRAASASRLLESYVTLLGATLSDATTPIERLALLSAAEIHALTAESDRAPASYTPVPVHLLFQEQATKSPTSTAASFQGNGITYAELDARSSQLAHHLIAVGVGPEIPVAVCVRPSVDVLVSMLAIWKARGIYLPLDPTHPEALIQRMLEEARPKLVLTNSELSRLSASFPQLCFDTDAAVFGDQSTTAPQVSTSLTDAAYLFYTSGTTGKSKGVLATQRNLAQYIHSAAQKYGFNEGDVFVSLARYTFSISLFELVSPLCCGGTLKILERDEVLTPERLCRALEDVTVLHAGPSLLGSLFRHLRADPARQRTLPRMRHASSGGDIVPPSIMEELKRVFPNAELFVIYGCTEVSCMGTTFVIDRQTKASRTFVGKSFPDVTMRVLDSNRNLVPYGVVGEICFAGLGVVRGYLDRPELTAEKFVELEGKRFYQTGDMGRVHADGNLEILGRRDFQVQLRGIRIELAGIETTVQELGLAAQCAVVARTLDEGDVRLVAFVVKPTDERVASFRRALAAELPDYMIPHQIVVLDAMPLTTNGKLDRNRLKEMPWENQLGASKRTPAANEREQKIADAFAHVLGLAEVGVEDSFFDSGGDSLLGVVALEEIERSIGVAVPPHVLFENGTVRALANYTAVGTPSESKPVPLNSESAGSPLFMLSGIHIYRGLAKHLDGRCSAYGVFARREVESFDPESGSHSIEDLARDYLEIIRRQQPVGPYRLLGYSFAGIVAYEVARQFRAAGEEVRFLALLDAALPEWTLGWRFRVSQIARLWSAPPRDVYAYIVGRVRDLGENSHAEFLRYREDLRLGPLEERRELVNRQAAAEYMSRLTTLRGHVTLIVSGERLHKDPLKSPDCGWGQYIPALDIHTIDTDHFRMMSNDPWVGEVAAILADGMQRSEASTLRRF